MKRSSEYHEIKRAGIPKGEFKVKFIGCLCCSTAHCGQQMTGEWAGGASQYGDDVDSSPVTRVSGMPPPCQVSLGAQDTRKHGDVSALLEFTSQ